MQRTGTLTKEVEQEIRAELENATQPRGACLVALKVIQRHHGWVSDDHLCAAADLLGLTPEEMESSATFYNHIHRKATGRHIILVCESVTCWFLGHEEIRARLQEKLGIEMGGTTADQRFTMLPVQCLGACDRAPAIMIDDDLHCDLTPDKIDNILAGYL